jgi:hypothetical protein
VTVAGVLPASILALRNEPPCEVVTELMGTGDPSLLVSTNCWFGGAAPFTCDANVRLAGEALSVGAAVTVNVTGTTSGLFETPSPEMEI